MEKYSLSPVQWTNDGVIKPTRKLIEDKIVWVEDVLSFKPDANQYGIATMTHKLGNITYVQWNNKNYLVESCIELNNGLFKYNLESDIWVNLVIPFFEKNESKSFNIIREGKQWMDNNSLRFNDPLIDQYDIQYDKWLPYNGVEFITSPNVINRTRVYSNKVGDMLNYSNTPAQPSMTILAPDSACKYFVFTSTFNGFNNSKVDGSEILSQQYLVFPVIDTWSSSGGKTYNNYEAELQKLAIVNSTEFIGVFKGPAIGEIDLMYKTIYTKDGGRYGHDWLEMQYSSTGDKWLLFCETGERPLSLTRYNNLNRYDKIIIGETEVSAQYFNNYGDNDKVVIHSIFTGSGFSFYPAIPHISANNYIDRKVLYGSYGSFLPYIGDDYKSYITQNASQINTGLISAGVGVATSAVGVLGAAASIPFTGGLGVAAVIGAGAGLISSATALKDKQDNLSKMRRHNETKPVQSNINDIANYLFFSDPLKAPESSSAYSWVKKPTRDSQSIINRIAAMYGIPVQKTITGRNLCQAPTNEPEPYEIDALSINFWLSATSSFTKLEKTLITISLNGPYVLVNNYGDIKRRMLIVEENELVEEIRQNKILKNLYSHGKEEENEKEDI